MNLSPENRLQSERTETMHAIRRASEQIEYWKLKKYAAERVDQRRHASALMMVWESDLRGQRKKLQMLNGKVAA